MFGDQQFVDARAIGIAAEGAIGRRGGQVFAGDEVAQALQRRQHLRAQQRFAALPQRRLRGRRDLHAYALQWIEPGVALGRGTELLVELRQYTLQHRARWHPAECDAALQPQQFLVDAPRHGRQARQHGFDLRRTLCRHQAQQLG